MHRMDANPCALESSRSQLSNALGFISKSLTVASEYSIENVEILEISGFSPYFTAFSSVNLKVKRVQLSRSRGESKHYMDANPRACESSRSQLSHAQEFRSKSPSVRPKSSFKNVNFLEISLKFHHKRRF